MGLAESMKLLHQKEENGTEPRVYDSHTGLELHRASDGELVVTLERGDRWISESFRELMTGDCSGLRGTALESGLLSVMQARLDQKYRGRQSAAENARCAAGDRKVKELKEDR